MRLDVYLSRFAELRNLYELVRQDFLIRGLEHHNWNHVLRDLGRAVAIGEKEGADMRIVLAGVLLHDIGRLYPTSGKDHYSTGARLGPRYLESAGFTNEIEKIVHCIRSHGPRGPEEPKTVEAKVSYDVDVLSCSAGYLGVGRVFSYFMREEGLSVRNMVEMPGGRKGYRKDFYTKTGRRLGSESLRNARNFWKGLEKEWLKEQASTKKIISDYEGD